jgi:hypothetical protein
VCESLCVQALRLKPSSHIYMNIFINIIFFLLGFFFISFSHLTSSDDMVKNLNKQNKYMFLLKCFIVFSRNYNTARFFFVLQQKRFAEYGMCCIDMHDGQAAHFKIQIYCQELVWLQYIQYKDHNIKFNKEPLKPGIMCTNLCFFLCSQDNNIFVALLQII